jgi:hypothetical protein
MRSLRYLRYFVPVTPAQQLAVAFAAMAALAPWTVLIALWMAGALHG